MTDTPKPDMSERECGRGTVTKQTDPETIAAMSAIADDQIRPDNPDYLDGLREFRQAVDIGRRIIKQKRPGGRPSKVNTGITRVEVILDSYDGDQQRQFLINDIRDIRGNMSRPTWRKFVERSNEIIADRLDDPFDVDDVVGPEDRY